MESLRAVLFGLCAMERDGYEPPVMTRGEAMGLAHVAVEHGVAGWLLERLVSDYGDWGVTEVVRGRLLDAAHDALVRSAAMIGVMGRMSKVLREGGVEPIVLKGLAVLREYYPDMAMRDQGDIDILILNGDEGRATEMLMADGAEETRHRVSALDAIRNHLAALRYRGITVEIHRNLARHDVGSVSAIRDIGGHVERTRYGYSVLDSRAMLCHLAIHAASHYRRGATELKFFVDVALVVARASDVAGFVRECMALAPGARGDIRYAVGLAMNLLPRGKRELLGKMGMRRIEPTEGNLDGRRRRFGRLRVWLYGVYVDIRTIVAVARRGRLWATLRYAIGGDAARNRKKKERQDK